MNKLILLFLSILFWLQYLLWFGKNGLHDYNRINYQVITQKVINAKLKARNNKIFTEIADLSNAQEVIEEKARNELGMIKPGETFYRLVPNISKHNTSSVK